MYVSIVYHLRKDLLYPTQSRLTANNVEIDYQAMENEELTFAFEVLVQHTIISDE
jgi:Zn finger protein HypA/HybF involved in hydrogenase expression